MARSHLVRLKSFSGFVLSPPRMVRIRASENSYLSRSGRRTVSMAVNSRPYSQVCGAYKKKRNYVGDKTNLAYFVSLCTSVCSRRNSDFHKSNSEVVPDCMTWRSAWCLPDLWQHWHFGRVPWEQPITIRWNDFFLVIHEVTKVLDLLEKSPETWLVLCHPQSH